jgi:hypothetical protein
MHPQRPSWPASRPPAPFACALILAAMAAPGGFPDTITNGSTAFSIDLDGAFSGGVSFPGGGRGVLSGEWSDAAPLAFVSPDRPGDPLFAAGVEEAAVNCLLAVTLPQGRLPQDAFYAAVVFQPLASGSGLRRGQTVAEVRFPFTAGGRRLERFTLRLQSAGGDVLLWAYDLEGDGTNDGAPSQLGIEAAAGFGPSPLSRRAHLVIELKLPLEVAGGLGGVEGEGGGGIDAGSSSPLAVRFTDGGDVGREGADVVLRLEAGGRISGCTGHLPSYPGGSPGFIRGDCNGDGQVTGMVTDAVFLLAYNFTGGSPPGCLAACDANGDGHVTGSVTDALYILLFNFGGGPAPPAPFPACGAGTAADALLGCQTPPAGCG